MSNDARTLGMTRNPEMIDNIEDLKNAKGLNIVQLNCRSILNKIEELRHQFNGVDILACSETWLNDSIPNYMVEIREMDLFRWDRQNGFLNGVSKSRGGGEWHVILIKSYNWIVMS